MDVLISVMFTVIAIAAFVSLFFSHRSIKKSRDGINRTQQMMQMYDKGLVSAQTLGSEMGFDMAQEIQNVEAEQTHQTQYNQIQQMVQNSVAQAISSPDVENQPVDPGDTVLGGGEVEPEETIGRHELLDFE